MAAPQAYCPDCGYPNDTRRGACLVCYAFLRPEPGGQTCPHCQASNARSSSFCVNCQTALAAGMVALQKPSASLDGMLAASAGLRAAPAVPAPLGDFDLGDGADYVEDLAAPAAPPLPPAHEYEPIGAPAGLDTLDLAAPAPPPGTQTLDLAPPAPSPGLETIDLGAPAPPPGTQTLDLAAPAPPPGTLDLDIPAPPAPPPPPAPPAPPAGQQTEEEFGGWSLDYEDQQQK